MSESVPHLGLLGAPNSGKTTLFNALTGLRAKVGNYPGVTVEHREGRLTLPSGPAVLIDLPGTYSLSPLSADEALVAELIEGKIKDVDPPDALIVTADACTLERSLLLVGQILRIGLPTCLVITMMDELRARGGKLDISRLARGLGVPVVGIVGNRGLGIGELRSLIETHKTWTRPVLPPPKDILELAGWTKSVMSQANHRLPGRDRVTEAVDAVLLHPLWGSVAFFCVMLLFFQLIFSWATPAMNLIDSGVKQVADEVRGLVAPGLVSDFLTDGVIAGVGAVIIFLPQIVLLFALLTFLEGLGYMARAAFVVDRVMGRIGLEGRAFVALLSSYACAVPGIMATRTVPSPRTRLVTILVAPLMTCSARLPIYTLLIGAFVPVKSVWGPLGLQGLALFSLYLLGGIAALAIAAILKRTLVKGDPLPFYLELPPYRWPRGSLVVSQVWHRAGAFLRRAGTIIFAVAVVLWVLLNFPRADVPDGLSKSDSALYLVENSVAGKIGHAVEPMIAPLGFDWKIGVGLLASLMAREVIVATLAQVYATTEDNLSLQEAVRKDRDPRTGELVFTAPTVASLLVFFVFALQCTSTLAVMRRETHSWRWPMFAFGYLFALAYGASFLTYRVVDVLV